MKFNEEIFILFSLFCSFAITFFSIPTLVKVANAKNLYDIPNSRKSHTNNIPTLGGLAIYAGLIISTSLFFDFNFTEIKYILAGLTIIFFLGVKDDILVTAPDKKLIGELLAIFIIAVLGNIRITSLHGFLGIHEIPYVVSILLTTFVVLVILNGFNLIDGIDGLASSVGIISALVFGIWFYLAGHIQYTILSLALVGGLIAFFYYNVYNGKYKMFMGDTGSLIIGMVLAVLAIQFNEANTVAGPYKLYSAPAISFGILIIPLFDTLRVFTIRVLRKKSPFKADKNHVHHRLLKIGHSHIKATTILVLINILFVIAVFLTDKFGIGSTMIYILAGASILSYIPSLILKRHNKLILELQHNKLSSRRILSTNPLQKTEVLKSPTTAPKEKEPVEA